MTLTACRITLAACSETSAASREGFVGRARCLRRVRHSLYGKNKDIAGFLHSPDCCTKFANDLKKMLPCFPLSEKGRGKIDTIKGVRFYGFRGFEVVTENMFIWR
jgi:hypothetical protein